MKKCQFQWFFTITIIAMLTACGGNRTVNDFTATSSEKSVVIEDSEPVIGPLDTKQNIDHMTLQELRILRSSVYAQHGMLFVESDLRNYWKNNTVWYDTLSHSTWKKTQNQAVPLTPEEQGLVDRIDKQIKYQQQTNYLSSGSDTTTNILNIVNMFQFTEITGQNIMDELAFNSFSVVADTLEQLFQVYQRNDSLQLPNFVTTDLMLQLSQIYYSYMLRIVEEEHFAPMLAEICLSLYQASMERANKEAKEESQNMAYYNAAFYAIPYTLVTGKSLKISGSYQMQMEEELAYVSQQEDHDPTLLSLNTSFPYSAFQPYGHYTRTATLRRYFKTLKWLQLAPYCYTDKTQLQQAVIAATLLNSVKTKSGESLVKIYRTFFEAASYLYGQPTCGSVLDIALFLQKEKINDITTATNAKTLARVGDMLKKAEQSYPRMEKYPTGCNNGIYFIPQPYYADDDVLQIMTDKTANAGRAFPEALDVFAAFGSQPAYDKLLSDHQVDSLWPAYSDNLSKIKTELQGFPWNSSLYNKWLECLLALQKTTPHASPSMKGYAWKEKNLTTASASWMKLKHDVLLYGQVPDYPEPLDTTMMVQDSLPQAIVLGYVEPDMIFWQKLLEWIELTGRTLNKYQLMNDELRKQTARLYKYVSIMKNASEKELKREKLNEETYRFIAHIGDSIEHFTLSMITPPVDRWDWTAGADRSVAICEKVYQRNVPDCPKNGALYAATGKAGNIYAIVEIDGYLYLTKGATLAYYEFYMPKGKDLNEDGWRIILKTMEQYSSQEDFTTE